MFKASGIRKLLMSMFLRIQNYIMCRGDRTLYRVGSCHCVEKFMSLVNSDGDFENLSIQLFD